MFTVFGNRLHDVRWKFLEFSGLDLCYCSVINVHIFELLKSVVFMILDFNCSFCSFCSLAANLLIISYFVVLVNNFFDLFFVVVVNNLLSHKRLEYIITMVWFCQQLFSTFFDFLHFLFWLLLFRHVFHYFILYFPQFPF